MEEKSLPKYLGPDTSGRTAKMSREEVNDVIWKKANFAVYAGASE